MTYDDRENEITEIGEIIAYILKNGSKGKLDNIEGLLDVLSEKCRDILDDRAFITSGSESDRVLEDALFGRIIGYDD